MALSQHAPSRHAHYGQHWGEGAARCFSIEGDFLNEDQAVRLQPVPDSFICPVSAGIMVDPVATVDGCAYERESIEQWFRERRQHSQPITSPITGLELPSATLMPLLALQRAIEAYMLHRPELKLAHMAGRSFQEAAQILQTDLFEKQTTYAGAQEELKRLRQANRTLRRLLREAETALHATVSAGLGEEPTIAAASRSSHTTFDAGESAAVASLGEAEPGSLPAAAAIAPRCCRESSMAWPSAMGSMACIDGPASNSSNSLSASLSASLSGPTPVLGGARKSNTNQKAVEVASVCRWVLAALVFAAALSFFALPLQEREQEPLDCMKGLETMEQGPISEQVEQLWTGTTDERQHAALRLRNLAAENLENQEAIVQAGAIVPLVQLLQDADPNMREEAARALWNLARSNKEVNGQNQVAIAQAGAIRPLIELLEDEVPRVRVVAAAMLNDLAMDNGSNQVAIARAGAIGPLINLLRNDDAPSLVMASGLLQSLATHNSDSQVAATLTEAIGPLVELLTSGSVLAQEEAALTLSIFATCGKEIQTAIVRQGAVDPLVARLQGDIMQGTSALALRNLAAGNPENQAAIAQAGAIAPLVRLLEDSMSPVREEAARALLNLAKDNLDVQLAIMSAEGVVPLADLLKGVVSETRAVQSWDAAGP